MHLILQFCSVIHCYQSREIKGLDFNEAQNLPKYRDTNYRKAHKIRELLSERKSRHRTTSPFIIFDYVFHRHTATDYQYDPGFNKIAITALSDRTHLIESSYRHRARDR